MFQVHSDCFGSLNSRCFQTSVGQGFFQRFFAVDSVPEFLKVIRDDGIKIYAAETNGNTDLREKMKSEHEPGQWCLILGNENEGIRPEVLTLCDDVVTIPQKRGECLSLTQASAILLFALYS